MHIPHTHVLSYICTCITMHIPHTCTYITHVCLYACVLRQSYLHLKSDVRISPARQASHVARRIWPHTLHDPIWHLLRASPSLYLALSAIIPWCSLMPCPAGVCPGKCFLQVNALRDAAIEAAEREVVQDSHRGYRREVVQHSHRGYRPAAWGYRVSGLGPPVLMRAVCSRAWCAVGHGVK